MKTRKSGWVALGALIGGFCLSTSAHAVWNFGGYTSGAAVTVSNLAATTPFDAVLGTPDPTVSLSGVTATNSSGVISGNWSSSGLVSWGTNGLGMQSTGESGTPNHSIDNVGKTEAVLMSFSSSVALSSIGLGWTSNGQCTKTGYATVSISTETGQCATGYTLQTGVAVDLAVFRWTGVGAPSGTQPPYLAGQSATTMSGWELVGEYGDMGVDTSAEYGLVNSSGKTSTWWLISAYNSGFTQTPLESRPSLDNGNDFFKLYAVAGTACANDLTGGVCKTTTGIPEPATLALTSVALLGVVGLRRRRQGVAD